MRLSQHGPSLGAASRATRTTPHLCRAAVDSLAHSAELPSALVARVPQREKLILSFVLAFIKDQAPPPSAPALCPRPRPRLCPNPSSRLPSPPPPPPPPPSAPALAAAAAAKRSPHISQGLPAQLLVNGGYVRDLLLGKAPDDLDVSLCLRECAPDVTLARIMELMVLPPWEI